MSVSLGTVVDHIRAPAEQKQTHYKVGRHVQLLYTAGCSSTKTRFRTGLRKGLNTYTLEVASHIRATYRGRLFQNPNHQSFPAEKQIQDNTAYPITGCTCDWWISFITFFSKINYTFSKAVTHHLKPVTHHRGVCM